MDCHYVHIWSDTGLLISLRYSGKCDEVCYPLLCLNGMNYHILISDGI